MKRNRKPRNPQPSAQRAGSAATAAFPSLAWHLLLLAAATLGAYAAALRNGFVADDTVQLLQNPFITSYHYIPRLFATNVWAFANSGTSSYYRPLQMLVYMLEYYSFGFHPWPFHLVNLLAGLATVFAAYFLVRALAGSASLALWTALLFALHPVHVEPMVWIAALPDLLCGFALFTAMIFYHRARIGTRPLPNHALATALFFAALFCKEPAMVFPALLLAYEFLYRRESLRSIFSFLVLRRLASYVGALAVYFLLRVRALGSFAPASGAHHRLAPWQNFLSTPVLFAHYVFKLLWPVNMNYYYYFIPENAVGWKSIVSVLLIAVLIFAMFRLRRTQPLLSFAIAWFFITLAPALSIENVSDSVFAERYAFIPSLSFCVLVAWAVLHLIRDSSQKLALQTAYSFFAVLLVFYLVQIERHIPDWYDGVSLFANAARQSPLFANAQLDLGESYYQIGKYDLAIAPIERSLALGHMDYEPHLFLALSLAPLGRYNQSNAELQQAHALEPADVHAWSAFGVAHSLLRQWDRAADCYRHATEEDPRNQLMFELLGEALQQEGDLPGAMAAWRRAIQLQPGYLDASNNLAFALAQSGSNDEAITLLTVALQAHPRDEHSEDAYVNLGTIYMHRGEWDAAATAYQQALELNPNLNFARRSLETIEARRQGQQ